jgi:predicted metal-binding membrane protein
MAGRRCRPGPAALLWGATAAAWGVLLVAPVPAGAARLHHGVGTGPAGASLAMWTLMVAMMLPAAAAPALAKPPGAGSRTHAPAPGRAISLAAYLAAWLGFGAVGLVGHVAVQAAASRWAWLDQRSTFLAAAMLAAAGLYQFSPAKRRFLTACRNPLRLDGPGRPGPGRVGLRLAVASLGSCWALMLAMFALDSVAAMAGLTVVTGAETTTGWGSRLAGPLGVVLLYGAGDLALTALAVQ